MKEGGAHAIKLEGGIEVLLQVEMLACSDIPVMAHIWLKCHAVIRDDFPAYDYCPAYCRPTWARSPTAALAEKGTASPRTRPAA